MTEINYTDFDLLIERSGEKTYRVRVLYSPTGRAVREMELPFSPLEIENFLLKVGRTRRGVRRLESPEMEAAKEFGGKLFKSIFQDEIMNTMRSSIEAAQEQKKGLRLRLRLNDAPELLNLPWEYLYNPALNRFLSLSVSTPVVRYLEMPERILPLTIDPPLKMLVVISSPSDYPSLDVEREWGNLMTALGGLIQRGVLQVERLETATPIKLQTKLRRNNYHIFHFIGHGGYNNQSQDGVLLFEDEGGSGRQLSGQFLGTLLHDETSLRLAVLNACEGGRTGMSDPFSGVAQSLIQQGLPAVIAMQFEVTDQAAITFAREFYTAIADNYPVDASLAEARKAIFSLGNDIEWGTPVLYMRSPDGVIFDLSKSPEKVQKKEQPALPIPESPETIQKPVETQQRSNPETIYQAGLAAYQKKDWEKAWTLLRQVKDIDPAYRDLETKLDEVRNQLLVIKLYEQAGELFRKRQWQATVAKIEQIQSLQPDFPDPKGLLANARQWLNVSARQKRLQELYHQAKASMQARKWQDAVELLLQAKGIDPGYRETERLLEIAQAEMEKAKAELKGDSTAQLLAIPKSNTFKGANRTGAGQVASGVRTPAANKPRNLWLFVGLGGGCILVPIAIIIIILISRIGSGVVGVGHIPTVTSTSTETLVPTIAPTSTGTLVLTITPTLTATLPPTNTSTSTETLAPTITIEPTSLLVAPDPQAIYRIQVVGDERFLHLDSESMLLTTLDQSDDDYSRFYFEPQGDGSYRIYVLGNQLYLHEDGLGDKLIRSPSDQPDDDYTRFYLELLEDGSYRIKVKETQRYLHEDGWGDQLVSTRYQGDDEFTHFRLILTGEER